MTSMKVARLVEPGQPLEVGTADKPVPGPKDVLVRVAACGLVPNAYNLVNGLTKHDHHLPELPAVMGLDVAGTIEAVGEHVIGLEVGERVYVDPYLTCENCHHCRRGRRDLCPHWALRGYFYVTPGGAKQIATYPIGGFSEFVLSPDRRVAKLPDSIDFLTAARFGYVGTSFAALRKGDLGPGKTLLINGVTGTLGVAAVAIALGMGATKVLGIGRSEGVLKQVELLAPGRVHTVSSTEGIDLDAWVRGHTGGLGADVMYDCLGLGGDAQATNGLLAALKSGGRAVLVAGGVVGMISRSYFEVVVRDVTAVGSNWFDADDIDLMISMIGAGVIDLSFLEHRAFSLDEVNEALDDVGCRLGGFANVVVVPGHDG